MKSARENGKVVVESGAASASEGDLYAMHVSI
jgi:hypothetical protein